MLIDTRDLIRQRWTYFLKKRETHLILPQFNQARQQRGFGVWYFYLCVGTYLQVYFPLCRYFMRCPSESWVEKLKKQNGSFCGKMKRGKKMGKIEYWSFLHVNSWQYHTMCICKVQLGLIFSYAYICKHFTPLKIINIIFPPFVMVPF